MFIHHRTANSRLFALLLVFALLAGCLPAPVSPTPGETVTPAVTKSPPTLTATSSPTKTLPPPTPILTLTPRPTSTYTTSPTWTPFPTLEPTEAAKLVLDLLSNNAGCELPCWWGFMPSKTPWKEAEQFLRSFVTKIYPIDTSKKIEKEGKVITEFSHTVDYVFSKGVRGIGGTTLYEINDVIDTIEVYGGGTHLAYSIPKMLQNYGQPQEIYLHTYPDYWGEGVLWFEVFLFLSGKTYPICVFPKWGKSW